MAKNKPRIVIKDSDKQKIAVLGEEDVGIIIRENLEIELLIPNRGDQEVMGDAEMQGFAIMMALGDPVMSQQIMDMAEERMNAAENSPDEVEVEIETTVEEAKTKKSMN